MAYVTPTTVLTNDLIAAGDWNKNTVDNPIALRTGEIALTSQAVGDLVIATSATQLGRVADVAVGQVLVSGGVTTAPAYSASPSITALTYTTNLKSTTALATPAALIATQATAFASTVSGAAIMGFGTTNDVSLMNRAGTVVLGIGPNTTTVNMTGLLSVTGFGTHTFSGAGGNDQSITLRNNTAAGAEVSAFMTFYGDTGDGGRGWLRAYSSSYTTSGEAVADGFAIRAFNAGGLSVAAAHASGAIRFYSGGTTLRGSFTAAGNLGVGMTAVAGYRVNIKGDGNSANYALSVVETGGNTIFDVRNDGLINTGTTGANSPYNATTGVAANMNVSTAGFFLRSTSSLRFKTDFKPLDTGHVSCILTALATGEGAGFTYRGIGKGDDQESRFIGWGAETVDKIEPLLVSRDAAGKPDGVAYERATVYLTHGWQQHDATITQLAARIAALEGRQ